MKYIHMTRQALYQVDDLKLRADRDRLRTAKPSNITDARNNQAELEIVLKEIQRRPLIPEDVFK